MLGITRVTRILFYSDDVHLILGSASTGNVLIPPSILCILHSKENTFKVLKGKICNWKLFFFHQKMSILLNSVLSTYVLQCRNLVLKTPTRWTGGSDFFEDVSISDIVHLPSPVQTTKSIRSNQIVPESCSRWSGEKFVFMQKSWPNWQVTHKTVPLAVAGDRIFVSA